MTTINLIRKERQFTFLKTFFVPIVLLVILLVSLLVQTASAKGGKIYDPEPHVIFLVHGLLGDPTTFGDLEELLFNEYKNRKNIRVKTLYYPSIPGQGDVVAINNYKPFDFARIINTQIINYLVEEGLKDKAAGSQFPIGKNTPISFVVHSQGGPIVLSYLNSCYRKFDQPMFCWYDHGIELMEKAGWFGTNRPPWLEEKMPNLKSQLKSHMNLKEGDSPSNVHAFVSLQSPFWGAAAANTMIKANKSRMLKKIKNQKWDFIPGDGPDVIGGIGLPSGQIKQLAMGSETVAWGRSLMLDRFSVDAEENWSENTKWKSRYPETLKVYNIAGVITKPEDNVTGKLLHGLLQPIMFESDVVVGAPEARLDFLYYIENRFPGLKSISGRTNISQSYFATPSVHLPALQEYGITAQSLAFVTKDNFSTSLGFDLIRKVFNVEFSVNRAKNVELTPAEKERFILPELRNFTADIKVVTPPEYFRKFTLKDERVQIVPENEDVFDNLKLKRFYSYLTTNGQNEDGIKVNDNYYQTYYHVGRVNKNFAYLPRTENIDESLARKKGPGNLTGTYKLNYSVDVLGFETRKFTLDVYPSMNTYAEVYLTPYLPIQTAQIRDVADQVILAKTARRTYDVLMVMDKNHKLKTYSYSPHVLGLGVTLNSLPVCKVALMGKPSPPEHKGNSNFYEYALNFGRIQKEFKDDKYQYDKELAAFANSTGREISYGMPFEVVGRYAVELPGANGDAEVYDKYLVTSPLIREFDSKKSGKRVAFRDIGSGDNLGLRWVPVADVDMLKKVHAQYYDKAVVTVEIGDSKPNVDTCIKDNSLLEYVSTSKYRKIYYNSTSDDVSAQLNEKSPQAVPPPRSVPTPAPFEQLTQILPE